jgi:NhaP-type Na+/H+ or K+/H+ antiporter
LGVGIGYGVAKLITWVIVRQKWTQNIIHYTLITACLALLVIGLSQKYPYFSGYLATMAMGFFLIEFDPPLARQLRIEFNHLWIVAEIFLFVLMGASIEIKVLENVLLPGILLLVISLLFGRTIGWYLSTIGSNWNWREKLFLLPGNSAKATVQAAIGAIPLSQGISGGEIILAIAALSILITAPLGAWAIPTFAPKLLTKNAVDPTKVVVASKTIFLAVIDRSTAIQVLTATADFARRSNGEVVVVIKDAESEAKDIKKNIANLLLDIRYQSITVAAINSEQITDIALKSSVTNIILGHQSKLLSDKLNSCSIPVTFI